MPAVYRHSDFPFAYPDNWRVEENADDDGFPCVTVVSPKTAFWSLNTFPISSDRDELFDGALAALRAEYSSIDVETVMERLGDEVYEGFDVYFFHLDLVVRARMNVLKTRYHVVLLYCQAEDKEFESMEPVFQAMATSLLRGDAGDRIGSTT